MRYPLRMLLLGGFWMRQKDKDLHYRVGKWNDYLRSHQLLYLEGTSRKDRPASEYLGKKYLRYCINQGVGYQKSCRERKPTKIGRLHTNPSPSLSNWGNNGSVAFLSDHKVLELSVHQQTSTTIAIIIADIRQDVWQSSSLVIPEDSLRDILLYCPSLQHPSGFGRFYVFVQSILKNR